MWSVFRSVDPSSTTTISAAGRLWPTTLSSAASTKPPRFQQGITTAIGVWLWSRISRLLAVATTTEEVIDRPHGAGDPPAQRLTQREHLTLGAGQRAGEVVARGAARR